MAKLATVGVAAAVTFGVIPIVTTVVTTVVIIELVASVTKWPLQWWQQQCPQCQQKSVTTGADSPVATWVDEVVTTK